MIENAIQIICVYAIPLIFAITLHEAAHGWAAKKLGDDTAWILGRVTANPVPHIDPVGTVLVPGALVLMSALTGGAGFVFGWAKPVPINPRYFRHFNRDMMLTALAGPASNLLQAIARADDVRKNLADGGRRVGVLTLDEAAAEVEETLLQVDGGVDAARAHPAVKTALGP